MNNEEPVRGLFVRTHDSARSRMAQGLLRHHGGERFEAYSAGTPATRVRPEAIAVMAELGIDVSGQESETLDRYLGETFDYVVTVCDEANEANEANEACPFFPGAKERLHRSLPDPSRADGDEGRRLGMFRSVRDGPKARIEGERWTTERGRRGREER